MEGVGQQFSSRGYRAHPCFRKSKTTKPTIPHGASGPIDATHDNHPFSAPLTTIHFSTSVPPGREYHSFNVHKSAISFTHISFEGLAIGQYPFVCKLLKCAYADYSKVHITRIHHSQSTQLPGMLQSFCSLVTARLEKSLSLATHG